MSCVCDSDLPVYYNGVWIFSCVCLPLPSFLSLSVPVSLSTSLSLSLTLPLLLIINYVGDAMTTVFPQIKASLE